MRHSSIARYGFAVTLPFAAFWLNRELAPWANKAPCALFIIAVLLTVRYGGLGPALLAILVSSEIVNAAYYPLVTSDLSPRLDSVVSMALFVAGSLLICAIVGRLRTSEKRMASINERLRMQTLEAHHRIKNELQMLVAMTEMPAQDGASDAQTELSRLRDTLRTMAVIHELLTRRAEGGSSAAALSTKVLLEKLLSLISEGTPDRRIRVAIDEAPVSLKQGTALALILNELVSNALKHTTRDVDVRFRAYTGRAVLEVKDDGLGFPAGFDPDRSSNTGLELVQSIARWDLEGHLSFENPAAGGASVTLAFPLQILPPSVAWFPHAVVRAARQAVLKARKQGDQYCRGWQVA